MAGKRYFFSITDGDQTLVDRQGAELTSVVSARTRAIEQARQVVNELNAFVEVTDSDGASVVKVPLVIAGAERKGRDPLTGLAGFPEFLDHLTRAINTQGRHALGLLFLDIDLLKETNDAFGHAAGDAVICHVAALLNALPLEVAYAVARISGDKFGVLLRVADLAGAVRVSEDVLGTLNAPLDYQNAQIGHSISAGLAVFPDHAGAAIELARNADIALHHAKTAGSGRLVVYSDMLRSQQQRHIEALAAARLALSEDRIVPYYQPKVSLTSGAVNGFESLLRVGSALGIQPPSTIAEALDHPALAVAIGRRMQERVFDDIRAWRSAGTAMGTIAINASAIELLVSSYADDLLDRLEERGIPPDLLQVEVTETAMIGQGASKVMGELQRLRSNGISVFLDDFGTGYGSLIHLLEFSITGIKLDRSFIGRSKDDGARNIASLVIDLARRLRLELVAEGVETQEQADFLLSQGCEVMQGYLFAQAMPADEVSDFLSNWKTTARVRGTRVRSKGEQGVSV